MVASDSMTAQMSGQVEPPSGIGRRDGALPFSIKIGWTLGQLPIASHVGLVSFYLLYFVTDVHHVPPALAGIALLLPRLFNIGFDPVVGSFSDRLRTRWGRRRPFLVLGAIWWGLAIMILFGLPLSTTASHAGLTLLLCFLAVSIGQTLYHVPYSAMLAELSDREAERISLVSWKEAMSRIGILLSASAVPLVVSVFPNELAGYRAAGFLFGAIIMAGGLVAFVTTKRAPRVDIPVTATRITLRQQMLAVIRNRPFLLLVGCYVAIMLADEIFSESLIFFAVNVLGRSPAFVGQAYPISSIAAIATITLWNRAAVRLGTRTTLFIALGGMSATWLAVLAIPPDLGWIMLPLMGVGGAFNAGLLMLPNAMVPETIEYDAVRTGMRREGAIYGAWIFCQQSAMAAGGFILSLALAIIGYDGAATHQTASTKLGLSLTIGLFPAGLLIVAALLIVRFPLGKVIR